MADRLLAARQAIYTDALSPRDVNAQPAARAADAAKTKAAMQAKLAQKDKEHPPPPPPQVPEPASFDRPDGATYHVGKMLGKGGFAICYEGTQTASKKKYALKIVKSKMPSKMEQKFQTELQIHSKMRQANIVQFHRAFSFDNCTYLVLELCPCGSLMDMVKRRKGITEAEVRFYSVQIAGAIKYMHAKGIIHRDLKMGNIFLDKNMNAKIGDFGLAALLVTGKDMHAIRRTTLCGTPNYIAPEILQKGKGGHDHMVDIWSLGIIIFAMLTSKPPFQSATTDKIYERARNRDYDWPSPEQKYISEEVKELVASMLQEADQRPEPDTIVQHDFFLNGYVPSSEEITPKLRDCVPDAEEFYMADMTPKLASRNLRNLKELCRACEVGPYNHTQRILTSTWKEVAREEKAGLTPIIPLAENIVYRPYDEVAKEQNLNTTRVVPKISSRDPTLTTDIASSSAQPTGLLRAPPQSFAAQQRAQNRPARTAALVRSQTLADLPAPSASSTIRRRVKEEIPSSTANERYTDIVPENVPMLISNATAVTSLPTRPALLSSRTHPIPSYRHATTSQQEQQPTATLQLPLQAPSANDQMGSLFSPSEVQLSVPETKPDVVLDRLQRLHDELQRALNARTMAVLSSKTVQPPSPHIVVKWVDYTNRFGLGYILNDGGVGCVLRSMPASDGGKKTITLPPACMMVHDAERHIQHRQDLSYSDRHEVIPMTGTVDFYENNGEAGLSRVAVLPQHFKITPHADGTPGGKLTAGKDIFDHRKRDRLVLWKKFANYMMAYGRDQDGAIDNSDGGVLQVPRKTSATENILAPADVVTFYQRFGDVGCWIFCDGHLQFNFPDHTKIVLDPTGYWCHFWHLPQEAAEKLAATGAMDETALDERAVLSYPLQTLLNFATKPAVRPTRNTTRKRPEINPMIQGIPAANDLRRKIEFIKTVVKEWLANGGMGNSSMKREDRLRWLGHRETANAAGMQKHVWVTIGARWGDDRRTTLVDPRNPAVLGDDVEEKKRER